MRFKIRKTLRHRDFFVVTVDRRDDCLLCEIVMVSTNAAWEGSPVGNDCGGHKPLNSAAIMQSRVSVDLIGGGQVSAETLLPNQYDEYRNREWSSAKRPGREKDHALPMADPLDCCWPS